jgi:hypothetical protein
MSDQPPGGCSLRWAGVLVVLLVLVVALPVAGRAGYYYWRAAYHHREGVTNGCAEQFLADKADLAGYHWAGGRYRVGCASLNGTSGCGSGVSSGNAGTPQVQG